MTALFINLHLSLCLRSLCMTRLELANTAGFCMDDRFSFWGQPSVAFCTYTPGKGGMNYGIPRAYTFMIVVHHRYRFR